MLWRRMKSGFIDVAGFSEHSERRRTAVRKHLIPAAIAAAHAARMRRPAEAGLPLYLPAYEDRFGGAPLAEETDEDVEVDASGITIGGDEDHLY
jgi:hypothetical protein